MASWFTVMAPLLPELIRAARPMFTRNAEPSQVPKQIGELQDAVLHNDQAIKTLAAEMEQTLATLTRASQELETTIAGLRHRQELLERRLHRAHAGMAVAIAVALLAFAVAAYALTR
ncbi:hypothetical protein [Marilutibacter alkalisoli]|uniref:Uncharacterized protein n=1 Tax=Marilutibacter alkalisoli TaxID=2591633 RepID=A0A514BT27_9GAMM|nr:hypothetical protein [Lysobacter alkalisoli]QDH70540.1 hypothetical protein FKV23_10940 [Lysobacter alkalisoli]